MPRALIRGRQVLVPRHASQQLYGRDRAACVLEEAQLLRAENRSAHDYVPNLYTWIGYN